VHIWVAPPEAGDEYDGGHSLTRHLGEVGEVGEVGLELPGLCRTHHLGEVGEVGEVGSRRRGLSSLAGTSSTAARRTRRRAARRCPRRCCAHGTPRSDLRDQISEIRSPRSPRRAYHLGEVG
jgi:hypothetical protein